MHHIDENSSNNDPLNLIPLCPNCHLSDQHNPTQARNPELLSLFRRFKNPFILFPQFEPIFKRMQFLNRANIETVDKKNLESSVKELVDFISVFELGEFYAGRISDFLRISRVPFMAMPGTSLEFQAEMERRSFEEDRVRIIQNLETVISMIIEQLRYQNWSHHSHK